MTIAQPYMRLRLVCSDVHTFADCHSRAGGNPSLPAEQGQKAFHAADAALMDSRLRGNDKWWGRVENFIVLAMTVLLLCFFSTAAHADALPADINSCAPGYQPWDFTAKIVACVENTLTISTVTMLQGLSDYMQNTVTLILTVAIIFFGIRILMGEQEIKKKSFSFLIKLGIVAMFSYNLGNFALAVYAVFHQLIDLAAGGWSPWAQIDALLGRLIGFGPTIVLSQGLLGLIGTALFSSTTGVVLFGAGIMALFSFLMFVFDIAYNYLNAVLTISFLIIISTIVIPWAIYSYSEQKVKRWLDMLISVIVMQMLLFALLSMFIGIFTILINNIFTILGGNDFHAFWRFDNPAFSWLMPTDPGLSSELQNVNPGGIDIPPVQNVINPLMNKAFNAGAFNLPGVDFGANAVAIIQQLTYAFVMLWIFTSILKAMIRKLHEISSSITATTLSGIAFQSTSMSQRASEAAANLKLGAGAAAGGIAGGAVGGAIGGGRARQIGGLFGGLGGAFFGR